MHPKKSKEFPCDHVDHLPCDFGYLDGEIFRCNFNARYVKASWVEGDIERGQELLAITCLPIRDYYKRELEFPVQTIPHTKRKNYYKEFMENAKEGDIVFNTLDASGNGEVLLIHKCEPDGGQCFVRNSQGWEHWADPFCLRVLSSRDHELDHLVQSEDEASDIKCMAIHLGFTCDYEKSDSSYLITIQGSSEEELNDFLMLAINNDLFSILS